MKLICGVDEAGRGALAGPIAAAAVILHPDRPIEGLRDSKKISPAAREQLALEIAERSLCYGVGWATVREIDERGIEWANRTVLSRAVKDLLLHISAKMHVFIEVKIDGNRTALNLDLRQQTVVRGDDSVPEISAASIIAKVVRDRYMTERLHEQFPQYEFHRNKGYGTRSHVECISSLGPTPHHRNSFKVTSRWGSADEGK